MSNGVIRWNSTLDKIISDFTSSCKVFIRELFNSCNLMQISVLYQVLVSKEDVQNDLT